MILLMIREHKHTPLRSGALVPAVCQSVVPPSPPSFLRAWPRFGGNQVTVTDDTVLVGGRFIIHEIWAPTNALIACSKSSLCVVFNKRWDCGKLRGTLRASTSRWQPCGPALTLGFVPLALSPCDPRKGDHYNIFVHLLDGDYLMRSHIRVKHVTMQKTIGRTRQTLTTL